MPVLSLPRGHDTADALAKLNLSDSSALSDEVAVQSQKQSKALSSADQVAGSSKQYGGIEVEDPQGPFEGPEKLLELWFAPSCSALPASAMGGSSGQGGKIGLRAIERRRWEDMLDLVSCKVLSVIENEGCDAFLLR